MSSPAGRRRDAAQSAELTRAASRVLARDGVASATTRRIATEAGLPLGALHYWFDSKDDLLAAAAAEHVHGLLAAVEARADDEGATPDLRERFRAAWDFETSSDRGAQLTSYELITWALRTPGREGMARDLVAAFRAAAAQATGAWAQQRRAAGVDPDVLAQLVAALFDGLVLAWLAEPEGTDPAAVVDLVVGLLESAGDPPPA